MKTADLIVGTKYAIEGTSTLPPEPAVLLDVTRSVEFAQAPGVAPGTYTIQERSSGAKRYLMLCGNEAAFARAGDDFDVSALTLDTFLGREQMAEGLPSGLFLRCITPSKIEEPYEDYVARRAARAEAAQERREMLARRRAGHETRFAALTEVLTKHGVEAHLDPDGGTVHFDLGSIEQLVARIK